MNFDGFFLPGLDLAQVDAWRALERNGVHVRWPLLDAPQIELLWQKLSAQRQRVLLDMPVLDIVDAIDAAAAHMERDQRATAELLSTWTGYSQQVVTATLTHMLRDWRADSLRALLQSDLRDPGALDGPVPDASAAGQQIAAYGFPRVLHIFSGNVPGVAVTSLIRSLLVKSATLGKTASGEPGLPIVFARALQAVAPNIAACLAVTYWPGGWSQIDEAAVRPADALVVYGGGEAIAAYTRGAEGKRVVIHGPRLSFGVVKGDSNGALAGDVAQAVAAYDQQGCVSPHLVYVIGDHGQASQLARAVAEALRRLTPTLPRGALSPEEAVAVRNAEAAAEFAEDAELFGGEQDGFAVITEKDPGFKLSCLNRVLYVKAVPTAQAMLELLPDPQLLQSVAVAGFDESEKAELARSLGLAGVSRVTSFARLPWPPMPWHHDGSTPLGELIRWQDIEPD